MRPLAAVCCFCAWVRRSVVGLWVVESVWWVFLCLREIVRVVDEFVVVMVLVRSEVDIDSYPMRRRLPMC